MKMKKIAGGKDGVLKYSGCIINYSCLGFYFFVVPLKLGGIVICFVPGKMFGIKDNMLKA